MRVGIDKTFGQYNAPINPVTNDYLYMPIPEDRHRFKVDMHTSYANIAPHFKKWAKENKFNDDFPAHLQQRNCHLDPDFSCLTYGDQGTGRGSRVRQLNNGDFIAFFASFKPISPSPHKLIYALFGIITVDRIVKVENLPHEQCHLNAHSRILDVNGDHLVVFGQSNRSGRFDKAIPIGENRDGAYRVTQETLDAWGGLGVKNGFIQRSVCPPWFADPTRFMAWIDSKDYSVIAANW